MRSIDAEWDEDEIIDLGGDCLYLVQYGQSRRLVKSKYDPTKDRYGWAIDIVKYYKKFVDGKLEVFYSDKLVGFWWFKNGCLHNPYGPANVIYRHCGNMSFQWACNDKRYALREDNIVTLSGSIRNGIRQLFIMVKRSDGGTHGFIIEKENAEGAKPYFDIYGELMNEYKKH